MKWLIGIDEAGRGPLAGPVAVGVVAVSTDFDWSLIPGDGDSKKLSEKKREVVFETAKQLKKAGLLNFAVCQSTATYIDQEGIVPAIKYGMKDALEKLALNPEDCVVRLDGALRAPSNYQNQTTIIGGDGLEPVIGLASILAKVTRDRYMTKVATLPEYAPYELATHKGYGTKLHLELIKKHGLSLIHRKSFCRNCGV